MPEIQFAAPTGGEKPDETKPTAAKPAEAGVAKPVEAKASPAFQLVPTASKPPVLSPAQQQEEAMLHPAAPAVAAMPKMAAVKAKVPGAGRWLVRLVLNLLLILISLVLVAGAFYWGQSLQAQVESQSSILAQRQTNISRLDSQIKVEQGKQSARLRRLANTVQDIHVRSLPWTKIINAVEEVIPAEVSIFSYSGRYLYDNRTQLGRNIITIQGETDSYSRIANLIDTLEKAELFSAVKFEGSSKSVAEDKTERAQIKLSFDLKPVERTKDELLALTSPDVIGFGEEGGDSVSLNALELRRPLPPIELKTKSIPLSPTAGKIQLVWNKAAAEEFSAEVAAEDVEAEAAAGGFAAINAYLVKINQQGEEELTVNKVVVTNPRYPSYSFTFLTDNPQQKYEFRVIAQDIAGQESDSSDLVVAKAGDDYAPAQPQFILAQTVRSLSFRTEFKEEVHLVWQPGLAEETDIYRYHLYVGTDPDDLRLMTIVSKDITSFDYVDKVIAGPLYFRVVAEDTSANVSTAAATIVLENQDLN